MYYFKASQRNSNYKTDENRPLVRYWLYGMMHTLRSLNPQRGAQHRVFFRNLVFLTPRYDAHRKDWILVGMHTAEFLKNLNIICKWNTFYLQGKTLTKHKDNRKIAERDLFLKNLNICAASAGLGNPASHYDS